MTQAPEYRLVPVEPTLEMGWAYLEAAGEASPHVQHTFSHPGYRAAIAAAPHTAAPAADRAVSRTEDAYREGFRDAATFADVDTAWKLSVTTHLTAPPADRAELVRIAKAYTPCSSEWDGTSKQQAHAAIDALACSTDAPSEPVEPNDIDHPTSRYLLKHMMAHLNIVAGEPIATALKKFHAVLALATPPAAATSTPCASGEPELPAGKCARADTGIIECLCEPSDQARCAEFRPYSALAATKAPAVPATNGVHDFAGQPSVDESMRRLIADQQARTPTACNTEDARSMGAVSEALPTIRWPKERDVGRIGDMSPHAALRVGLDSDNDVYVAAMGVDYSNALEFCNPGANGGGQSRRTRMALIALMVAIEEDNAENPSRDFWALRAAPSTRADNQTTTEKD